MNTVIKVENLSKQYRLGQVGTGSFAHDVNRVWHRMLGKQDPYLKIGETNDRTKKGKGEYVWALEDISFEVKRGEVLGIIGQNGAGKSTLLKILGKVTAPTNGTAKIKGKIASLLEVGTGFHPELSGKENIYLNGAILGMQKSEIDRNFDAIVNFSGVERYLDTPVKRYSSGMYIRLAFAVAAHLNSEILILDEVLAVGDAEFQKKCLGKMGEVSKEEGKTILFVSHNTDAVLRLCNSAILIKNGRLLESGGTEQVISKYLNSELLLSSKKEYEYNAGPGNDIIKLFRTEMIDINFNNKSNFQISEKIGVKIEFEVLKETQDLILGFNLYNFRDLHILSSHQKNIKKEYTKGCYQTIVWLPPNFLAEGIHYCGIAAMSYSPVFVVHFHDIKKFSFNVNDLQSEQTARGNYTGEFPGVIRPILEWDKIISI